MGEITKIIDKFNLFMAAVITLLTAIFGAYWYIYITYGILNAFDWLSGWARARKMHEENSKVGLKGVLKKLGYWAIIALAFLVSYVITMICRDLLAIELDMLFIGWFTLITLIVNEIRSILENLVELGYNVPTVLTSGFEVADRVINAKINSKVKEKEGAEDE